jgi:arsenical pump membrane protein
MNQAVAYATLAMTITLALSRPRIARFSFQFSPGRAAFLGVVILLATRLLDVADLARAARLQWRPFLCLAAIMIMTGVVRDVGAFDRLAAWIENRARGQSAVKSFTLIFVLSAAIPAVFNNDAAILTLTPIVVAFTRRLFPQNERMTLAFAFAVFLAPGVAPLVLSNPMNMIVAEIAGLDFNAYAKIMVPISLVGALLTYQILRSVYGPLLKTQRPVRANTIVTERHPGEIPALLLMAAVFVAYPLAATFGFEIWMIAVAGAVLSIAIAQLYRIATPKRVVGHVSLDILLFLWGIFAIVQALQHAGIVEGLSWLYQLAPRGSNAEILVVGATSSMGSALIDNHPMALLNLLAIDWSQDVRPLFAALIGGDIGPRLLPIGSLAGLLWIDLLRREGIEVRLATFFRLGTLVLLPTLTISLLMLMLF